jgi:hypothetical protein
MGSWLTRVVSIWGTAAVDEWHWLNLVARAVTSKMLYNGLELVTFQ